MIIDRLSPSTMEENPLWLVVLCDMMTILMLFFLMNFVIANSDAAKKKQYARAFNAEQVIAEPEEKIEEGFPQIAEDDAAAKIKEVFAAENLLAAVEIIETRDTIRVRLRDQVLFDTASARLNPGAERTIGLLAEVLARMPNEVLVEGHTDSVKITKAEFKSNWELSVARSYSVIERLIAEGVPTARLVTAGYGEFHPLATNSTKAGRASNRRIEIVVLRCLKGKVSEREFDCKRPLTKPL